jgi:hypothetical protein
MEGYRAEGGTHLHAIVAAGKLTVLLHCNITLQLSRHRLGQDYWAPVQNLPMGHNLLVRYMVTIYGI